jgi:hypothetical protein
MKSIAIFCKLSIIMAFLIVAQPALAQVENQAKPVPESEEENAAKKEAEERFKKGLMFVDEGDCKKAIVEFREAYKSYQVPVILYNMALCYDEMHEYAEAMKHYKEYLETSKKLSDSQVAQIKERMDKLQKYLGTLMVTANVEGALVLLDGEELGTTPLSEIYMETGDHEIVVQKEGYPDFKDSVTVVSGKQATVNVTFKTGPPEAAGQGEEAAGGEGTLPGSGEPGGKKKKLPRAAFYGTLGATLALTVGAAVVGGLNLSNRNEFEDGKAEATPDMQKLQDLKDKGDTYNVVFLTLTGIAGAALIATIVVGVFTDFKKGTKEKPAVAFVPVEGGGVLTLSTPVGGRAW